MTVGPPGQHLVQRSAGAMPRLIKIDIEGAEAAALPMIAAMPAGQSAKPPLRAPLGLS